MSSQDDLPAGWAVKHYAKGDYAVIKGPGIAQDIAGEREDALMLFWVIYNAGRASVSAPIQYRQQCVRRSGCDTPLVCRQEERCCAGVGQTGALNSGPQSSHTGGSQCK